MEGDIESMQMRIAIFIDSDGRPREMSEKADDISKVRARRSLSLSLLLFGRDNRGARGRADSSACRTNLNARDSRA